MNLYAFTDVSPVIQIHAVAAIGALCIGATLYALPKGRKAHQRLGIACAILLAITAFTAAFIMQLNNGMWSFIHVFVPLTAMGLFGIVSAIRKRDWKKHREAGRGLIIGALFIPGMIAIFMPGRLMNVVLFG